MRWLFLISFIFLFMTSAFSAEKSFVYKEKNNFGLRQSDETIVVKPEYKKLIPLGENSFIAQDNNKFGLIDCQGNILVPIKYNQVDRILGKYLKIGTGSKYGLYDENGREILPVDYSGIDLLFGGMFLTYKDYKYGVIKDSGEVVLENNFDEIYMPKPSVMQVCYKGKWYEIESKKGEELVLPEHLKDQQLSEDFIVKEILSNPVVGAGYSVVTGTDYFLKIFSTISPAHEKTIDELMLLKGVDTVSIFVKLSWIPKYPFVYAKNYYQTFKTPNNGPLNEMKYSLKQKL